MKHTLTQHQRTHHKTQFTPPILSFTLMLSPTARAEGDDGKLRIIVFGAHPDDAQYTSGGTAAKWAKIGHHVKLVSVTNGDIGHWQSAGGPLAQRRLTEVHVTVLESLDINKPEGRV